MIPDFRNLIAVFISHTSIHPYLYTLLQSTIERPEDEMSKMSKTIKIKGSEITIITADTQDYISITDIAKYKNAEATALSYFALVEYSLYD